jgi:SsrA-binding protein
MAGKNKNQKKGKPKSSLIASNKRAYHEYTVEEQLTAGLELQGTEVKSLRAREATMSESFARVVNGEVFVYGLHIKPYKHGTHYNHDPHRVRKLLLNKIEIKKVTDKINQKGYSLIPLRLFFSRCWVKVELGLCKGKQLHDKRADLAKKDQKREMDRAKKNDESLTSLMFVMTGRLLRGLKAPY